MADAITLLEVAVIGLIGAAVGAIIAGGFNLYSKHTEYKHAYLKMILEKRIEAYEHVNTVIVMLKKAVIGEGKTYHDIFASDQNYFLQQYLILREASSHELWMSNKTGKNLQNLDQEFVRCLILHNNGKSLVDIGNLEYKMIGGLRDELEKSLLADLSSLYKIDNFLSQKEVITKYGERDISERPKI